MTECRTVVLMCICLFVLAGLQCNRGDRSQADKSTITIQYPGNEYLMGPNQEGEPMFMVFLPFAKEDENGEIEGSLAKSWEHSEDYRTWTVHLRDDVKWHDGIPVTAHDVKFTIDLLEHPDVEGIKLIIPNVESSVVLDDKTIVITYKRNRDAVDDWTVYYPKHLLEDLELKDIAKWDFWKQRVGNGPYRYVRHVPKTMIELEANPDYYAGPPTIQHVVIKFGRANLTELLSGNVDVIHYADRKDVLNLANDPRFHAYHSINRSVNYGIFWFQTDPLFSDARVRHTLTLAIDRLSLLRVLNMPEDIPIPEVRSPNLCRTIRSKQGVCWMRPDGAIQTATESAGNRNRSSDSRRLCRAVVSGNEWPFLFKIISDGLELRWTFSL